MKKNSKKIAVLNITSRCNLRCGFCFGPEAVAAPFRVRNNRRLSDIKLGSQLRFEKPAAADLTTTQLKNLILKLKKSGAKILIFSGGEPLLRRDIFELICFAKKLGFFTILHTNGILLAQKIKNQNEKIKTTNKNLKINSLTAVIPKRVGVTRESALLCLNQINLPLDGYNTKTNDAMRCEGHFKKVMAALQLLKNTPVRVIISTVATAKNKEAVAKIGKILPSWVHKWRIFQFNPQGKAAAIKKEFEISNGEFKEIKKKIQKAEGSFDSPRRNVGVAQDDNKKWPFKVQCVGMKDREFWEGYSII